MAKKKSSKKKYSRKITSYKKSYSKSYYSKRPLWQWVLIYIVIGGIVYAAIYYFVIALHGGYTSPVNYSPTGY